MQKKKKKKKKKIYLHLAAFAGGYFYFVQEMCILKMVVVFVFWINTVIVSMN